MVLQRDTNNLIWGWADKGEKVTVYFDEVGVPHINAENQMDAYRALGYVHAQDRLWQMTMLRRTAQGRLSELFGNATVDVDSFIRRLDLYALAVASVDVQSEQTLTFLEAYAAGVNAQIAQVNTQALGRGAPEMWLFNHAISPWRPADSLAVSKPMG